MICGNALPLAGCRALATGLEKADINLDILVVILRSEPPSSSIEQNPIEVNGLKLPQHDRALAAWR